MWVFSLVAVGGGSFQVVAHGFIIAVLLSSWGTGSRVLGLSSCGSRALEHRPNGRGTWA